MTESLLAPAPPARSGWRSGAGVFLREILNGIWPLLTLSLLWWVAFQLLPRNTFLKSPTDVIGFLTQDGNVVELLDALSGSLGLVALGYVVALCVAITLASAIVLSPWMERAVMPLAVIVGSIPIIVITPVMLMLFGRGIGTSVIVCTIVTFFPCLVNIIAGMRSPGRQLIDLTSTLGASRYATLLKVRFPSAVPGLISASKLALPAALSGVILTEFIATGTGIGNYINHGRANFRFNEMWAGISATLVASVLLYSLLAALEIILSRRYTAQSSGAGGE
ncbi:MAG: ABC transporter permease subunit [Propionibacteriaceae bacterium]|nr:ABC transporter permease subunit [Propionibacteriaceae bacterium]